MVISEPLGQGSTIVSTSKAIESFFDRMQLGLSSCRTCSQAVRALSYLSATTNVDTCHEVRKKNRKEITGPDPLTASVLDESSPGLFFPQDCVHSGAFAHVTRRLLQRNVYLTGVDH